MNLGTELMNRLTLFQVPWLRCSDDLNEKAAFKW
jgi:hypothetical protein